MSARVTVYTQVYNAEPYLDQCIQSVLNQSYTNIEYILVDNGCTDRSTEIIRDYAKKDSRIHPIYFETNRIGFYGSLIPQVAHGDFFTELDADDWWELDFLSRLVEKAVATQADIICTGHFSHYEDTGEISNVCSPEKLWIRREEYAKKIRAFFPLMETSWGKLSRLSTWLEAKKYSFEEMGFSYGLDTLSMLSLLRRSRSIYVDDSILHHYRIHARSISLAYEAHRFDAIVCICDELVDFLNAFGGANQENLLFCCQHYALSIMSILDVLERDRKLSNTDKMHELVRIVKHPLTNEVYQIHDPIIHSNMFHLLNLLAKYAAK